MNQQKPHQKIRCAIYDRVSTDIQAQHGLSLDTQKELLTEYALSHGYEIVDYYADEGLTARKNCRTAKNLCVSWMMSGTVKSTLSLSQNWTAGSGM